MPFAVPWMDLEIIIPGKVSQTEENKYCMICLYDGTHMWNLKKTKQNNNASEPAYRTEIDSQTPKTNVVPKAKEEEG